MKKSDLKSVAKATAPVNSKAINSLDEISRRGASEKFFEGDHIYTYDNYAINSEYGPLKEERNINGNTALVDIIQVVVERADGTRYAKWIPYNTLRPTNYRNDPMNDVSRKLCGQGSVAAEMAYIANKVITVGPDVEYEAYIFEKGDDGKPHRAQNADGTPKLRKAHTNEMSIADLTD